MEGWIKIHRSLLKWEWWDDHNATRLFIYLLLAANHEDKKWRGRIIKRGQLVTSIANLGKSTGFTIQMVRSATNKLKSTGEITSKATSHFTILTVCNYEQYQDNEITNNKQNNKQHNKPATNQQQTSNKPATTTKEYKKERMKELKNNTLYNLSFCTVDFLPVWEKWVDYRRKIGKPYRTIEGMEGKYHELIQLSGNDPALALLIVNQSIREEWTGLFPLKNKPMPVIPGEDPVQRMIREANEYSEKQKTTA